MTNQPIREIDFHTLKIGGESDFLQSKPVFALELNIFDFEASSHIVRDYYEKKYNNLHVILNSFQDLISERPCDPEINSGRRDIAINLVSNAQQSDCDILALKFNIPEENLDENIEKARELLKELLPNITKPLLIRGVNNKSVDIKLLPALMETLDREVIIAFADENTYKEIVPLVVKGGHILAIRTPIDINLANDMGLSLDKILIDTDMGGLGYGLEYGYSIMERIKLAAFEGDSMLNMPLIAFAGEEALKAKETKSDTFDKNYGDFKLRSKMFEITTASAVIAAGANLIVLENPESVKVLKNLIN
jgi:acetyl-CoA decarbonylase/synthase complex subunit delta